MQVAVGLGCHFPCGASTNLFRSQAFFRVIDVKRHCIINAPANCTHLALSYILGNNHNYQTNKANFGLLQVENGLRGEFVPKTIKDAMKLVSLLGERYLWVDALCII
jgi:hypothetical protein